MRKLILLLSMFFAMSAMAQEYYEASDLDISVKYWDDNTSFNYLVSNGTKLQMGVLPHSFHNWSSDVPTEILATYYLNGKFIVLPFSKKDDGLNQMALHTNTNYVDLKTSNTILSYYMGMDWFKIDFQNIVYSPIFNYVMIPCGNDANGNHWAICVGFKTSTNNIKSVNTDTDTKAKDGTLKYYDLSGMEVSKEQSKGQIVIEYKDGKGRKIVNK